ncbi:histidine phosphatase family protein [Dictyoglomus thermophilum]|uniref:Histidine phosphatase family protein n=1 Tax=Dictyoglomus thermophilum TaxID=14 RepID=A0A7V4DY65_DICTH|nr:histidine phosphatase family protein [Dictyoglomus thermophilum]TYT24502.1 histidine phosphatase family protein [Dictyoglomus thermophilum]
MGEIYLIRHGETDWNKEAKFQGRTDIPLNSKGKNQAELLSKYLAKENFDYIYSSPLKRAIETAIPLSKKLNKEILIRENWIEFDFGEWEGLTVKEVHEKYPIERDLWLYHTEKGKIPKGESFKEAYERLSIEKKYILEHHKNHKIAIFTHGAIIRAALYVFLDLPHLGFGKITISSCSITHFKIKDNRFILVRLNYLYPDEIFSYF